LGRQALDFLIAGAFRDRRPAQGRRMRSLHHFLARCRLGWPAPGRLTVHRRGAFAFEEGAEVPARLAARFGDLAELSAIDLGCGPVATPIAQAVFDVPWRRLVSVELFPPYLEALRAKTPAAREHQILELDIERVVDTLPAGRLDLALMIDVLEHLPHGRALRLLARLERFVRRGIVIFSPVGEVPQDDVDGNTLQRHRSVWLPDDWLRLGYDVELYEAFHGHLTPPADAAWAIKRMK
jgi:hypothetical protein